MALRYTHSYARGMVVYNISSRSFLLSFNEPFPFPNFFNACDGSCGLGSAP